MEKARILIVEDEAIIVMEIENRPLSLSYFNLKLWKKIIQNP
jgi:hypothetical protein